MIRSAASSIYGVVTRQRRQWYARRPSRQRRLARPVVSVGNLTVGGSGKTPVVEHLARLLLEMGEQPAVLSRGYGRRISSEGVTVVSDGARVLADVDHAGDEPLMLARALPGVPVVVAADRYLAGRHAEQQLGATVHLLDDGFQHIALWRDINLLLVDQGDLEDAVLPAGRLREPLSAAAAADALLTKETDEPSRVRLRERLGVGTVFDVHRSLESVRMVTSGKPIVPGTVGPVFAVAGIARPQRLFEDLSAAGWRLGGTMTFRDHYRFTQSDVNRIARATRDAQMHIVVTTAKDAVRFEPLDCSPLALAIAYTSSTVEPALFFKAWMTERLAKARAGGQAEAGGQPPPRAGSPAS
ncbi:MAG: tetraacyldisaccharide 4'-kinase [Vicinamibacterales bacterium]